MPRYYCNVKDKGEYKDEMVSSCPVYRRLERKQCTTLEKRFNPMLEHSPTAKYGN